jgi:hypothetical protein
MNPTDTTLRRQAKVSASSPSPVDDDESFPPVPYDDPSWFLSPVEHNGQIADSDFWEPGPWLPAGSLFYLAGRLMGPLVETDQGDVKAPARRRRARR